MKSIRLNVSIRDQLLSNIMRSYVEANPKPEVAEVNCIKIAVTAHFESLVADLLLRAKKAKISRDHLVSTSYHNWVDLEGNSQQLSRYKADPKTGESKFIGDRPYPNPDSSTFIDIRNTADPLILAAIKAEKAARKLERPQRVKVSEWETAHQAYRNEIYSVLQGVSTTKQLLEAWPEVEEYLPAGIVNPSRINLPAVNFQKLNEKLGK